jgi:hypothetical protein
MGLGRLNWTLEFLLKGYRKEKKSKGGREEMK